MSPQYIWQCEQWPAFSVDDNTVATPLARVWQLQKHLLADIASLPSMLDQQAQMDALIQSAIRTSEIEGEYLNVGSVRSSVAKQLGLDTAGLQVKPQAATAQTDSLINMLCMATSNLSEPLSVDTLCEYQSMLFPSGAGLKNVLVGALRGESTMQVVSAKAGREVVHFEAPPRDVLNDALAVFLQWFNRPVSTAVSDEGTFSKAVIRAAIAHFWFITLHPFDDGNGRLARAITDRALAQAEQTGVRFYSLSAAIQANKKAYYAGLETAQNVRHARQMRHPLDITDWVAWFIATLERAIIDGQYRINRVVEKAQFWQKHSQTVLSGRQVKVLNRLLDASSTEFEQGIAARQYQSIAKVSKATATRDLTDLLNKGCIEKCESGGRSVRYRL